MNSGEKKTEMFEYFDDALFCFVVCLVVLLTGCAFCLFAVLSCLLLLSIVGSHCCHSLTRIGSY